MGGVGAGGTEFGNEASNHFHVYKAIRIWHLHYDVALFQIEITNDVQFLLPIMCAIMVAKWVGDFTTHPIYHALLELKCIPFLDAEPVIRQEGKHM